MYKFIYDKFNNWYRDGTIYLYSDPHFSDEEMKYLRKNYIGDEDQIKRINSKVNYKDTIIFLGDIGDPEKVKKIRGYKVLIMGNHEAGATKYKEYFDEVYEGPLFISDRILLSHEPIDFPYALNIHGHDHLKSTFQDELHINLCAENIDYTPVLLKNIVMSGKLKNIKSIHRDTIDKAVERKLEKIS